MHSAVEVKDADGNCIRFIQERRADFEERCRMSNTALGLLEAAQLARKEHRLADAHRDLVEAVSLCRQAGEQRTLVRALKALGQIERDLGQGDAARPLYEEAVSICREEGDPLLLAHTIRHLGDIHQDAGRLTEAEPCYHEALALYRSRQANPLDLANAIRPLALLKEATGKREEARPLWEEARELYVAVNVRAGVAECSARLAGQSPS
jgi:tetratricopeptide (TPR) repeat protein